MIRITMRFPADMHKRLSAMAEKERRSFNSQVLYMIDGHEHSVINDINSAPVQPPVHRNVQEVIDPSPQSIHQDCPICARKYPYHHVSCPNGTPETRTQGVAIKDLIGKGSK